MYEEADAQGRTYTVRIMLAFFSQRERTSRCQQPPRLMDFVSAVCRRRHLSPRTKDSYRYWIRQYILFHDREHPGCLGGREVETSIRDGKGGKDRTTLLPERLRGALHQHLLQVAALHKRDLAHGAGLAPMPNTLARNFPSASASLAWQFVFPSSALRPCEDSGRLTRWHTSCVRLNR